jgi:dTDP-4-dehydrorhamnose 3,5-epimerase
MNFNESRISGCYEIIPDILSDKRGKFIKTFHKDMFIEKGLEYNFVEEYYSISRQGVLRGMHYQKSPHQHTKLVYCVSGEVIDIVIDLRKNSPTYGEYVEFNLNAKTANIVYIPVGMAHGFYTVSDKATLIYKVTSVYAPESDTGILWSSAGVNWRDLNPLVSERDKNLPSFESISNEI